MAMFLDTRGVGRRLFWSDVIQRLQADGYKVTALATGQ